MKHTISFDIDDVLADWHKKFKMVAERLFPQYGPLPDSIMWDQPNWPLTPQERTLLSMTWKTLPNFYRDLDLCPGVDVRYLRDISLDTHLIFTSSRHENVCSLSAHEQTVRWLRDHIDIDPVVVITDDKPPVLRATRAVLHVDDRPALCKKLIHTKTRPILMRHHQNQHILASEVLYPVIDNWDKLPDEIEFLLRMQNGEAIPVSGWQEPTVSGRFCRTQPQDLG